MTASSLQRLFEPSAVAVLGVSARADGVGRRVFENLREAGFRGGLYAVNPKHEQVAGVRAYPDVGSLPEQVDLAVIAVPAQLVLGAVRQCGEAGVRFAIVLSSGFSETGEAGRALLQEVLSEARRHQLRLLGPNCLGIMRPPAALNASFGRGTRCVGQLALLSQSGAICSAAVDWAEARGIGFSTVVSLGAAADLGFGDMLDYLAEDPKTSAILLYVEGIEDAHHFMRGLRAAARCKPVIVVKAGRHEAAARAAVSHTGALVGNDAVFASALRSAGAIRVTTLHELFSVAELLSNGPRTAGDRLAIVTNAGGLGVLAVDRAEDLGLRLASVSSATHAKLAALLPPTAATGNPIDLLGDAPPERYAQALALCLADPGVDGVLVLLTPQVMTKPDDIASVVAALESKAEKPVLACFMGGAQVAAARERLVREATPCFDAPEDAVEAFAHLVTYHRNQALLRHTPTTTHDDASLDLLRARRVIETALDAGHSLLSQLESRAVLEAFAIPSLRAICVHSLNEALAAAETLGLPVALKIDSPDITHKTEVRGVRLDLGHLAQVREAYTALLHDVAQRAPGARIDGVLVESMARRSEGRELLVGIARDHAFGPVLAFGAGGTLVELLGKPAVALLPLSFEAARDTIAQARLGHLLGTFRGQRAVDLDALARVLVHLSTLAYALPQVKELDINPLIASPDGVLALDVRILVGR